VKLMEVGATSRLERLGRERFDAGDGGGIQGLNKRDHEVDVRSKSERSIMPLCA